MQATRWLLTVTCLGLFSCLGILGLTLLDLYFHAQGELSPLWLNHLIAIACLFEVISVLSILWLYRRSRRRLVRTVAPPR